MDIQIFFKKDTSKEVKASIAYTACGIITRCLAFFTLPIFTRLLSTEEYGITTIYQSTAAIVVIFTSLNLPYGSLATAMIKFKDDRDGYLSSLNTITTVFTALYIAACIVFRGFFENIMKLPLLLIIVMGIEMLFQTAQTAWMGRQRFEYKYRSVVLVTIGSAVLAVVCSVVAVISSNDKGNAKVLANAAVVTAVGLVLYIYTQIKGKKPFCREYWRYALSFNLPLIPYYLSQVVFNQSDRIMIDRICGRGDAAIYGVAYTLAAVLTIVVTSIHSSFTPWIFDKIDRRELKDTRRVSLILSSSIAFMLLGIIALAPEIISVMAGKEYSRAMWVVPPVAMSVLLLYYADLFDCLLFFYEQKVPLAVATIVSAVANVILNFIFIPKYGFVAAAYTTLISYMLLAGIDYIFMRRICRKKDIDPRLYSISGLTVVFLVFIALGFAALYLYDYPVPRYAIVVAVLVVLFIKRKNIISFYKNMKQE